ncbi:PTS sugar transporter subunit IIA [Pseudolactococcus reticulitermitis]|uniref:PTS EIIA type-2 domain-containing protein n=1 Tax=Pseudolactococcus reticulitermitis TaxID=2025039 RepID=A0A224XBT3_9LACT|nr:PTS sugar transporter subunit IIA [Lactococcus reticulitermitis]GAX47091.1 hypothetical protein RsY01_672 [Lactococcus reticulitermitis]
MDFRDMFNLQLIDLNINASTEKEVFQIVAKRLKAIGMVNDGYLEGLMKREEAFPTGLVTQYLNIALPHSEPELIQKPFVFICRLDQEVACYQMGDNQRMKVKDLFFLGIKDGKNQVGLLQAFMDLFMTESFVQTYQATKCPESVYQLFVENIGKQVLA